MNKEEAQKMIEDMLDKKFTPAVDRLSKLVYQTYKKVNRLCEVLPLLDAANAIDDVKRRNYTYE